jgi:putative resolvase
MISSGHEVGPVVSGLYLLRILSDPDEKVVVVQYRDRLARFGVEQLEAAPAAPSRRIVVGGPRTRTGDLAYELIDVLMSACVHLCRRCRAQDCAMRAPTTTTCQGEAA